MEKTTSNNDTRSKKVTNAIKEAKFGKRFAPYIHA